MIESTICVYTKSSDESPVVLIRFDCILKGIEIDKMSDMFLDPEKRMQWDNRIKTFELLEVLDATIDVCYTEIEFPFPMSNRDLVQVRYFLDSKNDADLLKKYDIPEKNNRFFLQTNRNITRQDCPEKEGKVRAEMINYGWILEEIPDKPGFVSYKCVLQQDIKGLAPTILVNKFAVKAVTKGMVGFLEGYKKLN
jgi:hypothetical protein